MNIGTNFADIDSRSSRSFCYSRTINILLSSYISVEARKFVGDYSL